MTKGLKIWLWLMIIVNVIATLGMIPLAIAYPFNWINVALIVLLVVGAFMLLQEKMLGFYLICVSQVLGILTVAILGGGFVFTLIKSIVQVAIIYAFMQKNWDQFR